ncbi:MAG: crossover junction endodeoxyribonuclease RuvC [Burkholderiales bacterium]|nr:crossover junction endodeoxyribonuclease RuvC [Burkholderiales bacterium]
MSQNSALRILGIDPGLNKTGYGVISFSNNKYTRIDSGVIIVPQGPLAERLGYIFKEITKIIEQTIPHVSTIEKTFLNPNAQSSMLLSHARGAAMCAAAVRNLECKEFSTREIKKSVTGYGAAEKVQIQEMVHKLLHEDRDFSPDEADALATAICYANTRILLGLVPAHGRLGVSATATARKGGSSSRSRSQWTKKFARQ